MVIKGGHSNGLSREENISNREADTHIAILPEYVRVHVVGLGI